MTATLKLYLLVAALVLAGCTTTKETRKETERTTVTDREWFIPVQAITETLDLRPVEPVIDLPDSGDVPILVADEPATLTRPAIRADVTHNRDTGQFRLHLYVDSSSVKAKSSDTLTTRTVEIEREYQPPWYEQIWDWIQDKVFWLLIAAALFVALGVYKKR